MFVGKPSVEELQNSNVKKDDLKYIATSYQIPFAHDTTKAQLKDLILAHLGGVSSPSHEGSADPTQLLDIEKVKLEALKLKLQFELSERETTKLKLEREREEREREREEREREREEREREREERERERQHEIEERERQRQHEIQILSLQNQSHSTTTTPRTERFEVGKYIKLIPAFSEQNPDAFFREFENTANHFGWPQEHWVWLVKPKLVGKAVTVCEGVENNTDYTSIKETITAAYSISTEGYRQAFRNLAKLTHQTYT